MKYTSRPINLYLILLLVIASCGGSQEETNKIVRPVLYHEVGFAGGEQVRVFSGTAQTDKIINLSFRNSGIITTFDIRLGQRVKKGDLLAQLDNVQSRLAYEQSVSSLNSAASQMNTSKLNLDRIRSLYEKGSASLSDYENAKNSFRNAEASHQSAQRSVDIQQEQINYGFLYAPEDGTIAAVNSEIDENVSPGQSIAVLNAGQDMQISMGLPESVINRVTQDMVVNMTFSALTNQSFSGRVTEISPTIDNNTSTYPIRISIVDPTDDIKAGMAASVTFNFDSFSTGDESLVVPAKAVGEDDQGRFVFLISNSGQDLGTVSKQYISIGELTSEGFEVINGLSLGQKIATAGLQTLLEGQQVRLN